MGSVSTDSNEFYQKLDGLFSSLENFLKNYSRSRILQEFVVDCFSAFFYANLVDNFFNNLTAENAKELKLSKGQIGRIRGSYKDLRKKVRLTLSGQLLVDEQLYNDFKSSIKENFPGYEKIIEGIEKIVDMRKIDEYLKNKEEAIKLFGKERGPELSNDFLITSILETYVENKKRLPISQDIEKIVKKALKEVIPAFSKKIKEQLDKNSVGVLDAQRKVNSEYIDELYRTWQIPIVQLECLIKVSSESGSQQIRKLKLLPDFGANFKYAALIKIQARALQVGHEILALLKAGYPDGANSRWRSLYELAVISFFLAENSSDVSERYLDHEIVRTFKEFSDYQNECKTLGYDRLPRRDFNKIKRKKEEVCARYGDRFQDDYCWIPRALLADRNLRGLEKHMRLNKLRPFYNLSCDAVHSGPKGFYRLGLTSEQQHRVLLIGPSIHGLADPMQNTAISLTQISACILQLKPDLENIVSLQVMLLYCNEIGERVCEIQYKLGKEKVS